MRDHASLTTSLVAIAESLVDLAASTRWYVFGSASRGADRPADVDLLIVYDHGDVEMALDLREALLQSFPPEPIDLVLLHSDEEAELRFIERGACIQIWPAT